MPIVNFTLMLNFWALAIPISLVGGYSALPKENLAARRATNPLGQDCDSVALRTLNDSSAATQGHKRVKDTLEVHRFPSGDSCTTPSNVMEAPLRSAGYEPEYFDMGNAEAAEEQNEQLEELQTNPVDLNSSDLTRLLDIPTITEPMARAILEYRTQYGALWSVHELAAIPGVGAKGLQQLRPYVKASQPFGGIHAIRHHALDFTQRATYPWVVGHQAPAVSQSTRRRPGKQHPLGSSLGLLTRAVYQNATWLRLGVKGSKHAGEPLFGRYNPLGYGFYSGYAQVDTRYWYAARTVLGDYNLRPGYGLVVSTANSPFIPTDGLLWSSLVQPKGTFGYPGATTRRGLFLLLTPGRFRVQLFASYRRLNASIVERNGAKQVSNLSSITHFTTPSQMQRRSTLGESMYGLAGAYHFSRGSVGISGVYTAFQYPFSPAKKTEKTPRYPQHFGRLGPFFSVRWSRATLWGEGAVTLLAQHAGAVPYSALIGVYYKPVEPLSITLLAYRYSPDNVKLYQENYSSRSLNTNGRSGMRFLAHYTPSARWTLHALTLLHSDDHRAHSTTPLRLSVKSTLQAVYQRDDRLSFLLQYRYALKAPYTEASTSQHRALLQAGYQVLSRFIGRTQLFLLPFGQGRKLLEKPGWAIFQELGYSTPREKFSFRIKGGYFALASSGSTLYTYLPSPQYGFGLRSCRGNGTLLAAMFRYRPVRSVSVWVLGAYYHLRGHPSSKGNVTEPINLTVQLAWQPEF